MTVEDLLRRGRRVGDGPVEHGRLCDQADGVVRDPLPENDIRVVDVRLDLLLRLDVEYLKCPAGYAKTKSQQNLASKVYRTHPSTLGSSCVDA